MTTLRASETGNAIVYQATNKVNGHRYIGFTTKGLAVRENQHRKDARSKHGGFHFHRAIRKYGGENFTFEVLMDFGEDELLAKMFEREAIEGWKPEYNISHGGDGGSMPEETRKKISAATMGRVGSHRGKKFGEEHRRRISEAQRGRISPFKGTVRDAEMRAKISAGLMGHPGYNKGKKVSLETLTKMSAAHKGQVPWIKGKTHSAETKLRMSEGQKRSFVDPSERRKASLVANVLIAQAHNKVPVKCVTDGNIFDSSSDADRFYGFSRGTVRKVVSGERSHARKLVFVKHEVKK